jgi:hypothetical protein
VVEARAILARRELDRRRCRVDPAFLISFMSAPDERTAERFSFGHMAAGSPDGWGWQKDFIDWVHGEQRCIVLKARQLGITWLGCAYVVWAALYKPGSLSLIYRQKEEEAHENVRRCWSLLESLPAWLKCGAEVIKPVKGFQPSGEIRLRFPDGSISRIAGMSSAAASGHGKTAAVVLLDEFSRIDAASEIMKAVQPAAGSKGKILIISTANGRANMDTGEGNHFHWLWENAVKGLNGFQHRFLPWSLHPDRDQRWYETDPEIVGLKSHERAEQYPADPHEAFTLTNRVFFDPGDIEHYRKLVKAPLYRCDFVAPGDATQLARGKQALLRKHDRGNLRVYEDPHPDHRYAIGADVATGRGSDYSAAYVVDLSSMGLVAEFHARLDADLYAAQLHFLGRRYNDALLAPETAGRAGGQAEVPSVVPARDVGTTGPADLEDVRVPDELKDPPVDREPARAGGTGTRSAVGDRQPAVGNGVVRAP